MNLWCAAGSQWIAFAVEPEHLTAVWWGFLAAWLLAPIAVIAWREREVGANERREERLQADGRCLLCSAFEPRGG